MPVVSYISGGLDSTMVLGLTKRLHGEAMPSFTIGLDRRGPTSGRRRRESARVLGSPLTTVTMAHARHRRRPSPRLIEAAEGPVLDTTCACMIRLAAEVHEQGYKVVLTGEGADEALAGYIWFKTQKLRHDARARARGSGLLKFAREP